MADVGRHKGTGDEWSLSSANEGDPHGYEASADEK